MQKAYLRWYYGYKNFGDELLFFWVVDRIFSHYPEIKNLVIEVNNKTWMEYRVKKNHHEYLAKELYHKISFIEIKQHRWKRLTHIFRLLGFGKHRSYFTFFGGGEVLSDERSFPHDGRNIPLLFASTVRKGNFMLLGGIWTPKKRRTNLLYNILLPRAKGIITREETSYKTAIKRNGHTSLYQDFSQNIIQKADCKKKVIQKSYVLINCNKKSRNPDTKQRIVDFCKTHAQHKKMFFPCDMNDDIHCFYDLQQDIPDLEMFDRTKYSLQDSLCVFKNTTAAIWARLHFLLPLKLYKKPFISIKYAEKIYKMID